MRRQAREATAAEELETMRHLRAVLKRASKGLGFAASFVKVFAGSGGRSERAAVRRILLGTPVQAAFSGLAAGDDLSSELLRFIAALAKVSSSEASRGAERLSSMFDRWTFLKERRAMEGKVMAFRGLIVSVVSGVVVGMLASLAPIISGFQIALGSPPQPLTGFSPYEGAVFLLPSSLCLGLFLSPERAYLNAAVSLLAFVAVVSLMAPLAWFSLGA